jgi:hypothetical protein
MYDRYRGQNGLGSIPLSTTMETVAVAHVNDLIYAPPIDPFGPNCNSHSWYSGAYACCFDENNYTTAPWWVIVQAIIAYHNAGASEGRNKGYWFVSG